MSNEFPTDKILLFDFLRQDNSPNALKIFMQFVKIYEQKDYTFVYANHLDSLHPKMTIKENLLLDSLPSSIMKKTNLTISEFIYDLQNIHIKDLIAKLSNLNQNVGQLTDKEIKIVSLIKAIIAQTDFLFINKPDEFLDTEELEIVKKAVAFESHQNQRTIFISPHQNFLWPDIVNYIIKLENHNFVINENPLQDQICEQLKIAS